MIIELLYIIIVCMPIIKMFVSRKFVGLGAQNSQEIMLNSQNSPTQYSWYLGWLCKKYKLRYVLKNTQNKLY